MVINDGYSREEVDIVDFQENGKTSMKTTIIDPNFTVTANGFGL